MVKRKMNQTDDEWLDSLSSSSSSKISSKISSKLLPNHKKIKLNHVDMEKYRVLTRKEQDFLVNFYGDLDDTLKLNCVFHEAYQFIFELDHCLDNFSEYHVTINDQVIRDQLKKMTKIINHPFHRFYTLFTSPYYEQGFQNILMHYKSLSSWKISVMELSILHKIAFYVYQVVIKNVQESKESKESKECSMSIPFFDSHSNMIQFILSNMKPEYHASLLDIMIQDMEIIHFLDQIHDKEIHEWFHQTGKIWNEFFEKQVTLVWAQNKHAVYIKRYKSHVATRVLADSKFNHFTLCDGIKTQFCSFFSTHGYLVGHFDPKLSSWLIYFIKQPHQPLEFHLLASHFEFHMWVYYKALFDYFYHDLKSQYKIELSKDIVHLLLEYILPDVYYWLHLSNQKRRSGHKHISCQYKQEFIYSQFQDFPLMYQALLASKQKPNTRKSKHSSLVHTLSQQSSQDDLELFDDDDDDDE
jgi:hypothetical protein